MIAILEAHRAGLLRHEQWVRNITSGIIVGVVALPLAMAFAIATGVKPEQGLYTAIIAGFIVSVFGGSRLQIAGPTGAFVVILAGIVAEFGYAGLQLATLMAGVILIAMGLLRMGVIIRFIPAPVVVGFTAGIGVVIWVGQWPAFLGLPAPEGERLHQKLPQLIRSLPNLDIATTSLACIGLITVIYAPKIHLLRRIPGPLVALLLVTLLQVTFDFSTVATIGTSFGGIPTGLPSFTAPDFSLDLFLDLLGPALTIAMLGAIESLLSAVVADSMAGTKHNSNQELAGQGIANIVVALFGGIAATGAIARTATNVRNGGTSPIAGVTHSVVLLAVILALAPLASSIPLAVLAAILFIVAYNMSEVRHFIRMVRRAPSADVAILVITFLLTVFADLVVAVNVGVLLAMIQFLRRMASSVEVVDISKESIALHQTEAENTPQQLPEGVIIYSIEGPYFFAAVDSFAQSMAQISTNSRILIIRMNRVPFIDITGLQSLEGVIQNAERRGIHIVLTEANDRVRNKLIRAQIVQGVDDNIYRNTMAEALILAETFSGNLTSELSVA